MKPFRQFLMNRARTLSGPFFHPWALGSRLIHGTGNFLATVGARLPWGGTAPYCCLDFSQATLEPQSGNPNGVTATFTRASTATVVDFEGRVLEVLENEARFQGARRVENLANLISYTGTGVIVDNLGNGHYRYTIPASTSPGSARFYNSTYELTAAGLTGRVKASCQIRWISGDYVRSQFIMQCCSAGNKTPLITGEWQTISAYRDVTPSNILFSDLRKNTVSTQPWVFEIRNIQLEYLPGASSDAAPSEYISATTTHGANANGVKYFDYLNGNTVDANGVVTEAKGAPISGIAYLNEPAATNLATYSDDFTALTASLTANATIGAQQISLNVANASYAYFALGATAVAHTVSFWIRKVSGANSVGMRIYPADDVRALLPLTTTWQRVSITTNRTASFQTNFGFENRNSVVAGVDTSPVVFEIKHLQLEAGVVPTSYIPTAGAAVTRAEDDLKYNVATDPVDAVGFVTDVTALGAQSGYSFFGDAYRTNGGEVAPTFTMQFVDAGYWNGAGDFADRQRSRHAHYAANKNPGVSADWRLFRDGVRRGGEDDKPGPGVGGKGLGHLGQVRIGRYTTLRRFTGLFHSVKFFTDKLTDGELASLTSKDWSCPK